LGALRFILGDQLSEDVSALDGLDPARDVVLMAEVHEETVYVPHHKQKIAFILSAMRHFAERLRAKGIRVDYVTLDDPANSGSFTGELLRAVERHQPKRIITTEPGEWRVLDMMRAWAEASGLPVDIRADDRFFASLGRFRRWAEGRKAFRMEFFYREMRREHAILIEEGEQGGEPEGGQWNFDHDNRKRLPPELIPPKRRRFEPDAITRDVMALVEHRFASHFGDLAPFGWAVTREDALEALEHFIADYLPRFGDYQDAMKRDEPFLFHAVIAPYLNCGLLNPREICRRAETAYKKGAAPLNAVEGFIRQILGWREYVRGIYWLNMPAYRDGNALAAKRPLPAFYWTGETAIHCVAETVADTRRNAYAHHIQRLMVTGNFALLAGIAPEEVEAWYLAVYADAYEWVELPNVHGMAIYADGGFLASKPYAASGAYINRMSDYCGACAYDPEVKSGAKACPFNLLYWDFLIRNRDALSGNPRMAMPYRTLDRMSEERRATITCEAASFLDGLDSESGERAEATPPRQFQLPL
jgi:deoxyribodipyrimidine photolyase-related protein